MTYLGFSSLDFTHYVGLPTPGAALARINVLPTCVMFATLKTRTTLWYSKIVMEIRPLIDEIPIQTTFVKITQEGQRVSNPY